MVNCTLTCGHSKSNLCTHVSEVGPDPDADSVGPGFGLVIGSTSVPRLEVECCASNHIHVSSECPHAFSEIRELLRQMGSRA